MKKEITKALAEKILEVYEKKSFEELQRLVDSEPETTEIEKEEGKVYQSEVCIFWDDEKEKNSIRISCSIDDGGFLNAAFPHTYDTLRKKP